MLNESVFNRGMAILCERFDRNAPSPELRSVYYAELADLSDEEFTAGVRRAIRDREFFPPAADLRPPTDPAASEKAWAAVVKKHECYAVVKKGFGFDHEAAKEAARSTAPAGGWGMMPLDEAHWYRKRFMEAYESYATSREQAEREQLPPMTEKGRKLIQDAMSGRSPAKRSAQDDEPR